MIKSIFSLLLISISFLGFGQTPEQVEWNGQTYYVYPVKEEVVFSYEYLNYFELSIEEFKIWLEWKLANDSRANLELKSLKDSIQYERYLRKDDKDSVYNHHWDKVVKKMQSRRYYGDVRKRVLKNFPESIYADHSGSNLILPPVLTDLPNGKYIQYYTPVASVDKREKSRIVTDRVAAVFELKENALNGEFISLELNGDTLSRGQFVDGFQEGEWLITTTKSYGYYRKHFFSIFKNEQYESSTYNRSNFKNGLRNGKCEYYQGRSLVSIENYQDGRRVGKIIELTYKDSIVYDAPEYVDIELTENLLMSSDINYFYRVDDLPSKLTRNFLNWDEKRRLESPIIIEAVGDLYYKNLRYLTPQDSIVFDSLLNVYGNYSLKLPVFKSYYRMYDRKTNQLIYERKVDPVYKQIVGSRYFTSGQLIDTVWADTNQMFGCQRWIYDKNGVLLLKNGKPAIDQTVYGKLYGYDVEVVDEAFGGKGRYFLSHPIERNDTTFNSMIWNKHEELISYTYELADETEGGEVFYNDGYATQVSFWKHNYRLEKYEKGPISIGFEWNDHKGKLYILESGQPFEGEIAVEYGRNYDFELTKKGKLIITLPNYHFTTDAYVSYGEGYSFSDETFDNNFLGELLKLSQYVYDIGEFSGTIKNNQLDGIVNVDLAYSKTQQLNYVDGLPNGKIELVEKNQRFNSWGSSFPNDFLEHNKIVGGQQFEKRKKGGKSLVKSFELKAGEIDGLLTFYSSRGETVGVIPFENGMKNGKVYQYFNSNLLKAEFLNDSLVGECLFLSMDEDKYDTLINLQLDRNGNLVKGVSHYVISDHYTLRDEFDSGDEIIKFTPVNDSVMKAEVILESELALISKIDGFRFLESDFYSNNLLSYNVKYGDSLFTLAHNFKLTYFMRFLNLQYNGFSLGDSWEYQNTLNSAHKYASLPAYEGISSKQGYFTKYFPNGNVAREGELYLPKRSYMPKKIGLWKTYDFNGRLMHETKYFDSIVVVNNEKMNILGIQYWYDTLGSKPIVKYLIEEIEKYECASDDYYAERQFIVVEQNSPLGTMNGIVKNYFDNGVLMNEGKLENGIPVGLWKFFTPDGKLCRLGSYTNGMKNGKWLFGDLSDKAYIGDVCIDPDNEDYDFIIQKMERDKEIEVVIFKNGLILGSNTFDQ